MPYSDQQISQLANQLGQKGATPEDIEAFVSHSKAEQAAVANTPPPAAQPLAPATAPGESTAAKVGKMAGETAATMMGAEIGGGIGSIVPVAGTAVGAGLGAAAGYGTAKLAEWMGGIGKPATAGELAQNAILGAGTGPASTAVNGLVRAGVGAAKSAGSFAASDMAKNAIDNGDLGTVQGLSGQTIIPAAAGAVIGALTKGDMPELSDAARGKVMSALAGQKIGLVTPPSAAGNDGWLTAGLERLGGPVDLQRDASAANATGGMNVIRNILQLPKGAPVTPEAIDNFQQNVFNKTYAPVRNAGAVLTDPQYFQDLDQSNAQYGGKSPSFPQAPGNGLDSQIALLKYKANPSQSSPFGTPMTSFDPADALDRAQALRDQATKAFSPGPNSDPQLGNGLRAASKAIEDQIERDLISRGSDGEAMLDSFRKGRVQMAQAHLIDSSLTWAQGPDGQTVGTIIPGKFGSVFQKQQGQALSDGLDTLGTFASNQAKSMQNPATMIPSGRSTFGGTMGGAAGLAAGLTHGGWGEGIGMGAVGKTVGSFITPQISKGIRSALLSQTGQSLLANPNSGVLAPSLAEQGIKTALMAKASSDNNAPPGLSQYIAAAQTAGAQ